MTTNIWNKSTQPFGTIWVHVHQSARVKLKRLGSVNFQLKKICHLPPSSFLDWWNVGLADHRKPQSWRDFPNFELFQTPSDTSWQAGLYPTPNWSHSKSRTVTKTHRPPGQLGGPGPKAQSQQHGIELLSDLATTTGSSRDLSNYYAQFRTPDRPFNPISLPGKAYK